MCIRDRYPKGVVGIHQSLQGYAYPANRPSNNIPLKDGIHDHACDALRYYAVARHGVIDAPDIGALNPAIGFFAGEPSGSIADNWG